MIPQFEGIGTLRPADASAPPAPVRFSFTIRQKPRRTRPGLPPAPPQPHGRGEVRSMADANFAEGVYFLKLSDRQQRVQRLGADWMMLTPLV